MNLNIKIKNMYFLFIENENNKTINAKMRLSRDIFNISLLTMEQSVIIY